MDVAISMVQLSRARASAMMERSLGCCGPPSIRSNRMMPGTGTYSGHPHDVLGLIDQGEAEYGQTEGLASAGAGKQNKEVRLQRPDSSLTGSHWLKSNHPARSRLQSHPGSPFVIGHRTQRPCWMEEEAGRKPTFEGTKEKSRSNDGVLHTFKSMYSRRSREYTVLRVSTVEV